MKKQIIKCKKFLLEKYYVIISMVLFVYSISGIFINKHLTIYDLFFLFLSLFFLFLNFYTKKYDFITNFLPKNKLLNIVFLIVIITSVNTFKENNDRILYQQTTFDSMLTPIVEKTYSQEIYVKNVTFDSISIRFLTYARTNDAIYKFKLMENDNILYETIFDAKQLIDGARYNFKFSELTLISENSYKMIIEPINSNEGNSITIPYNTMTGEIDYMLLSTSQIDYFKVLSIVILSLIYISINYIINKKQLKAHRFYLICGIYFLITTFIMPPLSVPDEPVHYYRAYKLSQVSITKNLQENFFTDTIYAPNDQCLNYSNIEVTNRVSSRGQILECFKEKNNSVQENELIGRQKANNPVNHIIPAIGIKMMDIFSDSPLKIFFAGRILNLIFSMILIFYAIKIIPKNKTILLFVATIPMFIQQMCSYSYDAILNAVCLFMFAYELKIMDQKKNTWIDCIIILLAAFVILSVKAIYILILLPLLFRKLNRKNVIRLLIAIGISYLITLLWSKIYNSYGLVNIDTAVSNQDNLTNIHYLMNNPLQIFSIIYNTLVKNTMFYLTSMFGYFSWFAFKIEDIYVYIYIIVAILILKNNKLSYNCFNKKEKMILIIGLLLMFAATFAAMYFYWSSYGLNYVDGVQGRYFLPFLSLLLVVTVPKKQNSKLMTESDIYMFVNLMMIMYTILMICKFY